MTYATTTGTPGATGTTGPAGNTRTALRIHRARLIDGTGAAPVDDAVVTIDANPYVFLLLALLRRYEPDARLGTLIARLSIFTVPFLLV
ncbi:hypothetical protein [Streptomyces adelaidensis]|uniref:hypothetical protein n=1 Tax=Streptomyces adelaidensis TaxID=2796465 RepID=UPI001F371514|nr:hypothetical protein [Streptomyces adelaidensis]